MSMMPYRMHCDRDLVLNSLAKDKELEDRRLKYYTSGSSCLKVDYLNVVMSEILLLLYLENVVMTFAREQNHHHNNRPGSFQISITNLYLIYVDLIKVVK